MQTHIANDFNVPLNILSTWLRKVDDYKKAYETQGCGSQNKRMKADSRMWMILCMPG